jgi:hypothetical protein
MAPFFSAYDSGEAGFWEIVGRICGGKKLKQSTIFPSFWLMEFGIPNVLNYEISIMPLNCYWEDDMGRLGTRGRSVAKARR